MPGPTAAELALGVVYADNLGPTAAELAAGGVGAWVGFFLKTYF